MDRKLYFVLCGLVVKPYAYLKILQDITVDSMWEDSLPSFEAREEFRYHINSLLLWMMKISFGCFYSNFCVGCLIKRSLGKIRVFTY